MYTTFQSTVRVYKWYFLTGTFSIRLLNSELIFFGTYVFLNKARFFSARAKENI